VRFVNEWRRRTGRRRGEGFQGGGFARVTDGVLPIDDCPICKPSRYMMSEVADHCWKNRSSRLINAPNDGQKVNGSFKGARK
jgi:hypothetical protein